MLLPLVTSRGHSSKWAMSLPLPPSSAPQQIAQVVRVKEVCDAVALVQPPQVVVVVEGGRETDKGHRGVGGEGRAGELVLGDLEQTGWEAQNTLHIQKRRAHSTTAITAAAGDRNRTCGLRLMRD